jgi:hypothetical protein
MRLHLALRLKLATIRRPPISIDLGGLEQIDHVSCALKNSTILGAISLRNFDPENTP